MVKEHSLAQVVATRLLYGAYNAPIDLDISAEIPEETGVSIVAEMILVKRG